MLLILLFLFFLILLSILYNHKNLALLHSHLWLLYTHLLHLLSNTLTLIFLQFLNYLLPYLWFLEFALLSINLLKIVCMFHLYLFLLALDFLDFVFLLSINYMPIYNFVRNRLSLHFYKIENHLNNIFLNMPNKLHHVQIFQFLTLVEYFQSSILFALYSFLLKVLLFLLHFCTKS